MKIESRVALGQRVKDQVTGFQGIAECITIWRFGCLRIGIRPEKLDEKGMPFEVVFFDEPQVEVIEPKGVGFGVKAPRGGPRKDEVPNERGM